jgi:hypothetical protein
MTRLEILSLVPTIDRQCSACEAVYGQSGIGERVQAEMAQEYPPEMLADYARLSAWIDDILQRFGDRIEIRLIDPQSGLGLFKSLHYWVRHYPTFIINGHKVTGWDKERLEAELLQALSEEESGNNPVKQRVGSLSPDKIERKSS